tara:strand:- start:202 stop:387 length:186 start_codon:yes stop_codon:yes gene_type:complete
MGLYNWYYYSDEDIYYCNEVVNYLEDRLNKIKNSKDLEEQKNIKIKRLELSIKCIKYYHNL